jgi:hypothetical protein
LKKNKLHPIELHSRLWKLRFQNIMSEICICFHVESKLIWIKIRQDKISVIIFLQLKKVNFKWNSNSIPVLSSNIELNHVNSWVSVYLSFMSHWFCLKIEELCQNIGALVQHYGLLDALRAHERAQMRPSIGSWGHCCAHIRTSQILTEKSINEKL